MHPLVLRFRDSALERVFQQNWSQATIRLNRIWVACAMGFYLFYTLLAHALLNDIDAAWMWLRYAVAIPVILVCELPVIFYPRLQRYIKISYIVGSVTAFSIALILFSKTSSPSNMIFLLEMALIYVYCQHFLGVRVVLVTAFTIIAATSTLFVVAVASDHLGLPFYPLVAVAAALGAVGIFASYSRETFVRRNFYVKRVLRAETQLSARLADEATEASRAKSRFLATVSHELRTPLNGVIGYADALRHGLADLGPDPRVREYVGAIHDSGLQLLSLVENVLDLTHAAENSGELDDQVIELRSFLRDTVQPFKSGIVKRGLSLQLDGSPESLTLRADPTLVRQSMQHLLHNALKFNRKGGRVSVHGEAGTDGRIRISVADTGIGIEPEALDKAFQLFGQLDDGLHRTRDGLGIGLTLTKYYMDRHDGDIAIESAPGHGTVVSLFFPAWRTIATPQAAVL